MSRVKIEYVVDDLSSEFRRALEEVLNNNFPDADFDAHSIFRDFKRAVGRKCSTWENVRDQHIEKRCRHCGENS